MTRSARQVLLIVGIVLPLNGTPGIMSDHPPLTDPSAAAETRFSHCVEYHRVNLNILLDYSGSMAGWRFELARAFALDVVDELDRHSRLRRAGGIGFPILFDTRGNIVHGFNLAVTENIGLLRTALAIAPGPHGDWTPLYHAIVVGAAHLASIEGPEPRILVVLTDGEHLDPPPSTGPPETRSNALGALRTSSAQSLLIYASDDRSEPGAAALASLAGDARAEFLFADRDSRDMLVAAVLRAACANFAPTPTARADPSPLILGDPGFAIRLDGSASSDRETAFRDLTFRWRLTRPDGSPGPTHAGTGTVGAVFTPSFTTADLGTWSYALEVDDNVGGRHTAANGGFEIRHSLPRIDFLGGGTIDVLEELAVRTTIADDLDGGSLTFEWNVIEGPYIPPDAPWSTQEVRWATSARDITMLSDGTRRASAWRFHLTVRDDEGESVSGFVSVEVRNLPVRAEIEGPETVRVGEMLTLRSLENEDPDGGIVTRTWDVVQSPQNDPDGATQLARSSASTEGVFEFPTGRRDAGTWIFRLNVRDDEGESDSQELMVLVSAKPEVELEAPEQIGSLTTPLHLVAERSTDPDSPCDPPDYCHVNIDGPVRGVTPGIVRWSWSLVDVPIEHSAAYPSGGIEDVLGVPAQAERVDLDPGALRPGRWTFQLEVEDAEGDTDDKRVQVEVLDESGDPVAVVTPPRRYALDPLNRTIDAITISSAGSIDPDNLGGGRPLPGIEERRWEVLSRPSGCVSVTTPSSSTEGWTLFDADEVVDPTCHGVFVLQLTVLDDDTPTPREASARTAIIIGNCPDPVCIDYPKAGDPLLIEPGEEIDVPIYYHVDSSLTAEPFVYGLVARLEIFHAEDAATPVYTAFSAGLMPPDIGPTLGFHWTGHHGVRGTRPGLYHVKISLVNAEATPVYAVEEQNAIAIAASEDIFDCGDLWTVGFPDRRDGGAYPCVEYAEPFGVTGAQYRVYFPPHWDLLTPENPRLLRWTATAVEEAWTTLSTLDRMPEVAVVLSPRAIPDPEYEGDYAAAFSNYGPGEPCPIVVYPSGVELGRDDFKQTIAHEVAHCLQSYNYGYEDGDVWWHEGTATFLSNLVYPATNFEFRWAENYLHDTAIYNQDYPSAVFFQSLANHPAFGIDGARALMPLLATETGRADPAAVLAPVPSMADALHSFGRDWTAYSPGGLLDEDGEPLRWTRITDPGGGFWPAAHVSIPRMRIDGPRIETLGVPEVSVSGSTIIARYPPFSIRIVPLAFLRGHVYRLTVGSDVSGQRVSIALAPFPLGVWSDVPPEVRPGCGTGMVPANVIATNPAPALRHELRIRVDAVRDPSCR